jgi:hypothetical protein
MSTYLSVDIQIRLEDADDHRCAYCQTSEVNTGQPMTVDHILPRAQGGISAFDNLCFACRRCNEFKAGNTHREDPFSGEHVPLFHPRQDNWDDHFTWNESGVLLIGLTSIGRATIVALNINNPIIVAARRRWVSVGWHPPNE